MINPTDIQEIETAIIELQAYLSYFYNLKIEYYKNQQQQQQDELKK